MSRARGFTLLEALASVAILSVLMGALGAVAGQWLPQWRHGFTTLQTADLVGLALDRVAEDVALAEYARLDPGPGAPLFEGAPDRIVFVRTAAAPGAPAGLEIVRIAEGAEGVARASVRFAPGPARTFGEGATLLRAPLRLAFAYAGTDGFWRTDWRGEAKLPRAVRLSVSSSGRLVASTAFPLKLTAAPAPAKAEGPRPEHSD